MLKKGLSALTSSHQSDQIVRNWFALFESYCQSVDYDSAESLFAKESVSFGRSMQIASGTQDMRVNQWEKTWPLISNFKMDLENMYADGNETQVWGLATWTSIGFNGRHEPFYRPGYSSVILKRYREHWLAVHLHSSLYPGISHYTFGPKAKPKDH